jgi:hypothetical protein
MKTRIAAVAAALMISTGLATPANAASLAVFGQNSIGSLYAGGNTVTYVSDAQLSTAGFLSSFDAFVHTRDGFSFGQSLSAAAAANVKSFVTGNVVLFAGDFADDVGTANTDTLFNNALGYVLGGSGKGYIGEFNGALAAYASNTNGYTPIGLIQGTAGVLGFGLGGSSGSITAVGTSPITSGVTFPYNPGAVEYGFSQTGYNPNAVVAQFSDGTPAILASSIGNIGAVPEPASWAMMILGMGAVGGALRRRSKVSTTVKFA